MRTSRVHHWVILNCMECFDNKWTFFNLNVRISILFSVSFKSAVSEHDLWWFPYSCFQVLPLLSSCVCMCYTTRSGQCNHQHHTHLCDLSWGEKPWSKEFKYDQHFALCVIHECGLGEFKWGKLGHCLYTRSNQVQQSECLKCTSLIMQCSLIFYYSKLPPAEQCRCLFLPGII